MLNQEITSAQNQHFKWLKSLTQKKYRDKEGVMLLEGERLVQHGIQLGILPVALFIREGVNATPYSGVIGSLCKIFSLTENLFNQVSDTVQSQGVLAVFSRNHLKGQASISPHVVVIDQVQDPGNLGTLIRTCDALGLSEIYLTKGTTDPYSQKVLRATMGSIFNVKLHTNVSLAELETLKNEGYKVVSTALENSVSLERLTDLTKASPLAICFGNEGNGVSEEVLALSDYRLKIPMRGGAESFNVAVAAAIVLYQLQSKYLV